MFVPRLGLAFFFGVLLGVSVDSDGVAMPGWVGDVHFDMIMCKEICI